MLNTNYPSATLNISITQDMIVEDTEDFRITFTAMNPLDMFNGPSTVLVSIQDDDGNFFYFFIFLLLFFLWLAHCMYYR